MATGIVLTALVAFACAATLVITIPIDPVFPYVVLAGFALLILGAVWLILAGAQLWRIFPGGIDASASRLPSWH